jgi:hypothetical protein
MIDRVILHAGTPKTGTTSLQIALANYRDSFAAHGVVYPSTDVSIGPPKHQWLVNDLLAAESFGFQKRMRKVVKEAPASAHSVVLSTEGLFNHWWDFSPAGRAALGDFALLHNLQIWIWFRHPVEFVVSYYVQARKNPRSWVSCYGQDWSLEEMLDDPWFAKHLDYMGFVDGVRTIVGSKAVRAFAYRGSTVADFMQAIDLPELNVSEPRENITLGDTPSSFYAAARTRARIMEMCGVSLERLKREFDLDLSLLPRKTHD